MNLLHIPVDFQALEVVRLLRLRLKMVGYEGDVLPIAVRLWMDWATAATDFRPLRGKVVEPEAHAWEREELVHIIEDFCNWKQAAGDLIKACLSSGFMDLKERDGVFGLELRHFWRFNSHLHPDHKTMQQLGGAARAAKQREAELQILAEERRVIFERQGVLPFGSAEVTQDEQRIAFSLIMRMDRACGLDVRDGGDYSQPVLQSALSVVRSHTPEEINTVELYIVENRDNPAVPKLPDRILQNFNDHLTEAKKQQTLF